MKFSNELRSILLETRPLAQKHKVILEWLEEAQRETELLQAKLEEATSQLKNADPIDFIRFLRERHSLSKVDMIAIYRYFDKLASLQEAEKTIEASFF